MHIIFKDIVKEFERKRVLDQTGLEISSGDCCLLTGRNGAGKSTLLRICAGLLKPDQFSCTHNKTTSNWRQAMQHLLATTVYLHQDPYMFDGTVIDNLRYGLRGRYRKNEQTGLIDQALHWAQLETLAQRNAKRLSGGERQRVAIARAWLRSPELMLLDEPTANLDHESRRRTLKLLGDLQQQGIALVVASHDSDHFLPVATSRLVLENGRLNQINHQPDIEYNRPKFPQDTQYAYDFNRQH